MKPRRWRGFGLLLLLFIPVLAAADESEPLSNSIFPEQLFLVFDRAEKAHSLEQWRGLVEIGMAGLTGWEKEFLAEEYGARLARWLRHNWLHELPEPALDLFIAEIDRANRLYIFARDGSGLFLRDERGRILVLGADGSHEDLRSWQEQLSRVMQELLLEWENSAQIVYQELLACLDPGQAAAAADSARVSLAQYREEVRREFERLYRQAESQFVRARLEQNDSALRAAERSPAEQTALELIERTRRELEAPVRRLEGDPGSLADHREAALLLDIQKWQEDFQREFHKGLQAWNGAEQRFLEERIRWEGEARRSFLGAEESWQRAFAELGRARYGWIDDMRGSLDRGLAAWQQAEQDFIREYGLLMEQLAASSRSELDRLNREITLLLDSHRRSTELLELAESSIETLQTEIRKLELGDDPEQAPTLALLHEELAYWQGADGQGGIRAHYLQACAEAEQALLGLEADIRDYGSGSIAADPLDREIARLVQELEYLEGQAAAGQEGVPTAAARLQESLDRVEKALALLRAIAAERQSPVLSQRLDPHYRELKERELELLNSLQYLGLAWAGWQSSAEQLEEYSRLSAEELARSAREIFIFSRSGTEQAAEPLPFSAPQRELSLAELSDFSGLEEGELAEMVEGYFSGEREEVAARLSTDVTVWLLEMAGIEGGCEEALKQFGLAYYYDAQVQEDLQIEGAPSIDISILSNPNFKALVDEYLELGPYRVLYFDWSRFCYDVKWVYPQHKLLPQDYLAGQAQQAYSAVCAEPKRQRLYGFFKAMLASGHFAPGPEFIEQDLDELAYRYVDGKASRLQSNWRRQWWRFKWWRADEIASLRRKIALACLSGSDERAEISEQARTAQVAFAEGLAAARRLQRLLGEAGGGSGGEKPSGSGDLAAFLAMLAEEAGRAPNAGLARLVGDIYAGQSDAPPGYLAALKIVSGEIQARLQQVRSDLGRTVTALSTERQRNTETYLERLYAQEGDEGELLEAARALFLYPAFCPDDYWEGELAYARAIEVGGSAADRLEEIAWDLSGFMEHRLLLLGENAQSLLQLRLRQLRDCQLAWRAEIDGLVEEGLREWERAAMRLAEQRSGWYAEFQNEYTEKRELWDAGYLLLKSNRDLWIEQSSRTALTTGTRALAQQVGLQAERLIAEVQDLKIPVMIGGAPRLEQIVARALPGPSLEQVLRQARALGELPGYRRPLPVLSLPQFRSSGAGLGSTAELSESLGEEIYSRAALVTALQLALVVDEAREALEANILEANRNMDKSLSDLLQSAGYRRSGSLYHRSATVDRTLFGGLEDEKQKVPAYQYFMAPAIDSGVDLSRPALLGRSGEQIQSLVDRALDNLSRYMELIFGRSQESRSRWDWEGISTEFKSYFQSQSASFQAAKGYNRKATSGSGAGEYLFRDSDGLFAYHIGYEPVMKKNAPEEVQEPGYGQLGLIMAAFFRNEARQARGLAMLAVPWYNLRLWDDDADNDGKADGWLRAPTVRSVVNIAVSVATMATGNIWLTAAFNLVDDSMFTMADMASGYLSPEQGLLSLGKQALTGAATVGLGSGFDAVRASLGAFGEDAIGKTLLQGMESAGNRMVSATIGAVTLDSDGRLEFDSALYKEALVGKEALIGYTSSLAGTLVTNSLGELNLQDTAGIRLGNTIFNTTDLSAFNNLMGGISSAALQYALSGGTVLNLANFRGLAQLAGWDWFRQQDGQGTRSGPWYSHGLLELHIGGDGPLLALGAGGPDLSLTAMAAGLSGWSETARIARLRWAGLEGRSTLTAINALSYTRSELNYTIGRELLEGHIGVTFYRDRGFASYVDERQPGVMHISSSLMGADREHAAQIAAFMAHEGLHLYAPEAEEFTALLQGWSTYGDLMAHQSWLVSGEGFANTGLAVMARFVEQYGIDNARIASAMLGLISEGVDVGLRPAEWFISADKVGVKPYHPSRGLFHALGELIPINAWTRYQSRRKGINVDREHFLSPSPESDYQHLQTRDLWSVGLAAVDLLLSARIVGTSATATTLSSQVTELLACYFVPTYTSLSGKEGIDLVFALLENATSLATLGEYASRIVDGEQLVSIFRETKDYYQMCQDIIYHKYDSFRDFDWYDDTLPFRDTLIFQQAREMGIDFEIENRWRNNEVQLFQAVNEKMKTFMWLGEVMFRYNICDSHDLNMLYYGTVGPPVKLDSIDQYTFIPGFAELNSEFDTRWRENLYYKELLRNIDSLNKYNQMQQFAWGINPIAFDTFSQSDKDMFKRWQQKNLNVILFSDFDLFYQRYQELMQSFHQ